MFKIIWKSALILSLPVFTVYAQPALNRELLANQCYNLSQVVTSLVPSQQNNACIDKLYSASTQMKTAGALILGESTDVAKQLLDKAVSALQYAELNGCNRYIQISHSKLEAHKIKILL